MAITKNGSQPAAVDVTTSGTATFTNKTINLSNNTVSGTIAQFNTAVSDADLATLAGSETLTNKTINGSNNTITNVAISTAVSGLGTGVATFLATPSSANLISAVTDETGTGALVFANTPTLVTPVLGTPTSGTLTNCTGLPVSTGISGLGTGIATVLATPSSANLASAITDETGSGSLVFGTSPTIGTPAITGGTLVESVIRGLEEDVNVVASAATGTINFDVSTASIWYYTSNATANHTLNFRYSSGATLSSVLAVGDAITVVWMNTNGTTAYYPSTIQIDGSTVTPKVPAAISAGNASAIDAYSFTIIKTAATPTYTVLETQTKFA